MKPRDPGYSFCIITNGKRPGKLAREIASIRSLRMPSYEILLGGEPPEGLDPDGVWVMKMPEAARAGRLGEMRNRLTEVARHDHIIVADDDVVFHEDFYKGLVSFGEDYEVLCVRILNPDGSRFWDWATWGGPRGHSLLGYLENDPFVYVTGGLCIMKSEVADRVRWDETKGFYQSEDMDFSERLRRAGVTIKFNPSSTVTHDDARYRQAGNVVLRDTLLSRTFRLFSRFGRPSS